MTPAEYIWEKVPGGPPTDAEVSAVVEWCGDWVADTFGPGGLVVDGVDGVEVAVTPLQVLRGCERRIEGGLAFVLDDVRRVNGESCRQCGAPLNPVAVMLGPVCGKCVRDNHKQAAR